MGSKNLWTENWVKAHPSWSTGKYNWGAAGDQSFILKATSTSNLYQQPLHRAKATSGFMWSSSAQRTQVLWIPRTQWHLFSCDKPRANTGTEHTKEVLSSISLSWVRIEIPVCAKLMNAKSFILAIPYFIHPIQQVYCWDNFIFMPHLYDTWA